MARDYYEKAVFRNYAPGEDFQGQILRYSRVKGKPCDVDLTDYHNPDYSVLTESQLGYYLHWRDMLSKGVCLKGCRGFVSLRIAEIINSDMDPYDGIVQLELLSSNATNLGTSGRRIGEVMFDYCVVKGLPLRHRQASGPIARAMVLSEIMEFPASPDGPMAVSILCNRQDDPWDGVDSARVYDLFCQALTVIDERNRFVSGKSLAEKYAVGRVSEVYTVFSSEPYSGERDYVLTFNRFNERNLAQFCIALYRCCVKVIAKVSGIKGPTVSSILGSEFRNMVEDLFSRRLEPPVRVPDGIRGSTRVPMTPRERALMEMGVTLGVADSAGTPGTRGPVLFESPRRELTGSVEGMREDMVRYSLGKGEPCQYVPSGANVIDYAFLPPGGLEYHLHWRSMFQQGRVLDTDTGYLRLFISELVSSSRNPQETMDVLTRLEEEFGGTLHGRTLICSAMFDHAVLNNLHLSEPVPRRMERSVCMIMGAFFAGHGPEPVPSCYETIHSYASDKVPILFDEMLTSVLNRVLIGMSHLSSPDPSGPYGMFGSRILPFFQMRIVPFEGFAYFGPHTGTSVGLTLRDYCSIGWSNNVSSLANYARRYIDRPQSRRRLKAPVVFGVDAGPMVAEAVFSIENRLESERRVMEAQSMRLDMEAVHTAERDLRDVTDMMSVDDEPSDDDAVEARVQDARINGDPWHVLMDSIGAEGRGYMKDALKGTRRRTTIERMINGSAMDLIGDVVVQDGRVVQDYADAVEGSLEVFES